MPPLEHDSAKPPALLSTFQHPLPPSPARSTSHISTISVEGHAPVDTPRKSIGTKTPQHPGTPSRTSHNSLLNAPPSSRALRTRASTASSSRAGSLFDGLPDAGGPSTPGTPGPSNASIDPLHQSTASLSLDISDASPVDGSETSTPSEVSSTAMGKRRVVNATGVDMRDVGGEMVVPSGDARRGLKDLVRRSTVGEEGLGAAAGLGCLRAKDGLHSLVPPNEASYSPRKYYVLTNAGKPVFRSHDDSTEDNVTNLMGVAQTLISIFAEDDDRIRCIVKGQHRIAFLLKAPLYLICVSDWGEPEHVLRSQLEYIHLHILSVVSSTQLSRVFQRRSNFDLSRLLDGTETFLHKLIDRSQYDFNYLTSTLQPLRMSPAVRDTAAAALMPPSKFKDLLYVLLIAGGHIVTLLRPRKHSIHPSDLHLLLNTLASSSTLRSSETWLPICFPKFNPAGFVHAYVSYVLEDVGLVFVSADREAFEELRGWKQIVLEKLESDKTLIKIDESIPLHPYTVGALGCPGLRHFIYKSRQHVQITQPDWEKPYTIGSQDHKRLITLYGRLHDSVHARSGQLSPLKLVYIHTEHEACLAWLTKPFELYITVSPQLSKSAVVAAANTVAKWVLAEEGRVFLKDAPVF